MLQILKNSHFKLCFELYWEQCFRLSFCFIWTEEIQSRRKSLPGFGIGECHKPSAFLSLLCQRSLSWDVPREADSVSGELMWLQMKLSPAESILPVVWGHAKDPGSGEEPGHSRAGEASEKSRSIFLRLCEVLCTTDLRCWWKWDITPLFSPSVWSPNLVRANLLKSPLCCPFH